MEISSDAASATQTESKHQNSASHADVHELLQHDSNAQAEPSDQHQHQQHPRDQAASAELAQIPDSAVQDEQQPAAGTQTTEDSATSQQGDALQQIENAKRAAGPEGDVGESSDLAAAEEDSNGSSESKAAATALQQDQSSPTSSSQVQSDVNADHSLEVGEQDTQAHHNAELDQQQQEPPGRLYVSSQLDHASQQSLPESVQSARQDQQHSALANGPAADPAQHAADAHHTNGIAHEEEQAEAGQLEVLQSAPQQKHENDIPGGCQIKPFAMQPLD